MKTAVSIPDEVFHAADEAAERLGMSRSQFYARALQQLLSELGADPVTSALNALADEMTGATAPGAGRALIDADAWEW